jgi:hypothetical protein
MGARAQPYRGRGDEEVPRRSRHQPFRESRRDCRSEGLPDITCGEVDDGSFCAYGRRRNQRYLGQAPHADSKAPALFLPCWVVVCRSSLLVRQLRHRHPLVPWSGTGSVWGRSEHQQSCPGLQDMGELHCEQNAFMVGPSSVKPREMAAEGLFLDREPGL